MKVLFVHTDLPMVNIYIGLKEEIRNAVPGSLRLGDYDIEQLSDYGKIFKSSTSFNHCYSYSVLRETFSLPTKMYVTTHSSFLEVYNNLTGVDACCLCY